MPNPFHVLEDHHVIVWIGDLNRDELEAYLDEPGGTAYDEPISDFGRDLASWYDHDFIWAEASDMAVTITELCRRNRMEPDALIEEIVRRSPRAEANCILLLWNAKLADDAAPRLFADGKLQCIGAWEQEAPLTD